MEKLKSNSAYQQIEEYEIMYKDACLMEDWVEAERVNNILQALK